MSDLNTIIPNFRVHISISQANDEILISLMDKSAISPYFEYDAGYSWGDREPVSVIPFTSSPELLGKLVKLMIQISLFNRHPVSGVKKLLTRIQTSLFGYRVLSHYRAPGAKKLLKKREERRKFLVNKFGKDNPRFRYPPSFVFVASTASNYECFLKEYNHILVEDDGETNLRFIVSSLIDKSDLQPIQEQFPYNSSDEKLGKTILSLCKERSNK